MRITTPTPSARVTWCALGLALVVAGCGRDPVRPAPTTALDMTLELSSTSARPGEGIIGKASVTNVGTTVVRYARDCVSSVGVYVLGPDGRIFDNRLPQPLCSAWCCEPLAPRQRLEGGVGFDGKIYSWEISGASFKYAEPGRYTVVASFTAVAPDGQPVSVERRATLQWDPAEASP